MLKLIILTSFLWISQASAQPLTEQASIHVKHKVWKGALDAADHFNFLFIEKDIRHTESVPLDLKNVFIEKLSDKTSAGLALGFMSSENRVIIDKVPKIVSEEKEPLRQDRQISGTVTDEEGQPISGVSVIVKGEQTGGITNSAGFYKLEVPANATLIFSFIGYQRKEIAVDHHSTVDIMLEASVNAIDEIVVTALGIKKEKKALGYAVQEVKGADLVKAREPNGIAALTGKVAGLTITPSSNLFGDPGIYLRGRSGVLIVVDGVPVSSDSWNLSPDDIASYSVLKGASAAALYGQRGINGALVITTKKGGGTGKGFSVEFNSSNQLQTGFNAIPKAQTEYGAGDNFKYAFKDGRGGGINDKDYNIWGPKFEGQLIPQYNSPIDEKTGELIPIPWLARGKDNLTKFLRNGFLTTNNLAIATSSEVGEVRMSISQNYQRGQVPNTQLGSTNFNMSGGLNAGKKLRFEANVNYNRQYTDNYPNMGYGPMNYIYLMQVWGGADYDINDLRNYWQPGKEGVQQYNREYTIYNNPWFVAYENLRSYHKEDIFGHLLMNYKINDQLTFNLRTNVSSWNRKKTVKYPLSGDFYEPRRVGGYEETMDNFWENNTEASISYQHKFGDFGFKASAFGNLRTVSVNSLHGSTRGGLIVPGVYDLSNSVEQNLPKNDHAARQVGSIYGFTDIDYKNYLFLNLTGRFDRSSTMPKAKNTYFYPSASVSAILSEMIELPKAFSLLKLRGSYANVASDLVSENEPYNIYKLFPEYSAYDTRWDNHVGVDYSGILYNNQILPSRVKTFEVGLETRLFNGRMGLDVAYFRNIEGPGIVNVDVSNSSGATGMQKNAFIYLRKGFEITLDGTPIKTTDFVWNVVANWSTNHRWLKEIDGVLKRDGMTKLGDRADGYFIKDFQRDPDGNMIVGTDGLPAYNPYSSKIGYTDNNFVLSLNNSFKYKDFGLSFQVDGRFGGLISNYVDSYQWGSGTAVGSANEYRDLDWKNRDNDDWKGSVMSNGLKIVSGQLNTDQDGNIISDTRQFAPNDVPVLWQTWARNYYRSGAMLARSRTFVKLREVVLSYNVPKTLLDGTKFFRSASISLVGRNLLYFTGNGTKNMDLDQFIGDASFQTPSVKSFGLNINASF
ncbi:SusC/RagA family TonB-linked outer membrane protein [Sphingobacterium kitahiroshimense]|uniref:SusC/RagA family TonB-linked outer membrane protein n=1 Tax=Sphingobacterium kitahiroshimense TaxID=470446 RepID=A0ABV0BPW3_9SPHI